MTKKRIIRSISLVGAFLPFTIVLNIAINTLTFPPFGRWDFSHLPTMILAVTGHPWLATVNAFFGDIFGSWIRGWTPWLQISLARAMQGLICGYLAIFWVDKLKLKINFAFVLIIFILLYYLVEFVGYAEAFRFFAHKPYYVSAIKFFPPRLFKTPVMLPIWYYLMRFFAKKKHLLL